MHRPNRIQVVINLAMDAAKSGDSYETLYGNMRRLAIPVFDIHDYLTNEKKLTPKTEALLQERETVLKLYA